jgi:hypothetical protein
MPPREVASNDSGTRRSARRAGGIDRHHGQSRRALGSVRASRTVIRCTPAKPTFAEASTFAEAPADKSAGKPAANDPLKTSVSASGHKRTGSPESSRAET